MTRDKDKNPFDAIRQRIEGVRETTETEVSERQEKLKRAEAELVTVRQTMDEAIKTGKDEVYLSAHNRMKELEAVLEMNRARIAILNTQPPVTPEEYRQVKQAIRDTAEEELTKIRRELASSIRDLLEKAEKAQNFLNESNELLRYWKSVAHGELQSGEYIMDGAIQFLSGNFATRQIVTSFVKEF